MIRIDVSILNFVILDPITKLITKHDGLSGIESTAPFALWADLLGSHYWWFPLPKTKHVCCLFSSPTGMPAAPGRRKLLSSPLHQKHYCSNYCLVHAIENTSTPFLTSNTSEHSTLIRPGSALEPFHTFNSTKIMPQD